MVRFAITTRKPGIGESDTDLAVAHVDLLVSAGNECNKPSTDRFFGQDSMLTHDGQNAAHPATAADLSISARSADVLELPTSRFFTERGITKRRDPLPQLDGLAKE